jgi:hypothetical protein
MRFLASSFVLLLAASCHLAGDVHDVEIVDELRCLQASDCNTGQCQIPSCEAGRCGVVNVLGGEVCSTGVCDGQGLCQGCIVDGDCAPGSCQANQCVGTSCSNMMQDSGETGVDCGGACVPCLVGNGCMSDGDCVSNECSDMVCLSCEGSSCSGSLYCDSDTGACVQQKPLGADCDGDKECLSGECESDECAT